MKFDQYLQYFSFRHNYSSFKKNRSKLMVIYQQGYADKRNKGGYPS